MPQVTLVSYNPIPPCTATFQVDGAEELVTRPLSQEVTDETLEEHLKALARGLAVEAEEATLLEALPELSPGLVQEGTVLVEADAV